LETLFVILLGFSAAFLAVMGMLLWLWVTRPLRKITEILNRNDLSCIARLRCQATLDRGAGRSVLAPPLRLDERGVDLRLEACARVRLVLIERPEPLGVDHDDACVVQSSPGNAREPGAGCGRQLHPAGGVESQLHSI
jgi:hypothetical protein